MMSDPVHSRARMNRMIWTKGSGGKVMEQFQRPGKMLEWSRRKRCEGDSIALVPTMGALHEGHLSLVDLAAERADCVATSIFVNPTQFGPSEDFSKYPRDLQSDLNMLFERNVDAVFMPETGDIYPAGSSTWVTEEELSNRLEGISRPGHFRGVTTVVAKLLTIVEPDILVVGQKDAQQAAVIKRIMHDLIYPVELIIGKTVRELDGLALSSRNNFLSVKERQQAVALYESLMLAREMASGGERNCRIIVNAMRQRIENEPSARIDYISAVDPDTFDEMEEMSVPTLIALAVFVGDTRLIDNELIDGGN